LGLYFAKIARGKTGGFKNLPAGLSRVPTFSPGDTEAITGKNFVPEVQ
jgi:hypothetical protein